MSEETSFDFSGLSEAWGAPIVARKDVGKFSGGLLHPRTMANLDCKGKGPGKILVGGRACYGTGAIVKWLEQRTRGKSSNRGSLGISQVTSCPKERSDHE